MLQRYELLCERMVPDREGGYVRFEAVRKLVRTIVESASPCTSACSKLVPDDVLEAACESVGIERTECVE